MWPYVIESPLKIGTYGVMMACGFMTALWLLTRDLRRRNIDPKVAETTVFLGIIGGVIGAKLAYMFTEAETATFKDFFSGSGLTWHGGLILAAALIIGWYAWKKLPVLVMVDATAPMLASGYAFGRIGCQESGDGDYGLSCGNLVDRANCWLLGQYNPIEFCRMEGIPSFCMSYPRGIVPTDELVHPTPVYEALDNFALFGVLWAVRKRIRHPGVLFGMYLIGSGILRFAIEFIRQDEGRPYRFWGLRDAHLVALGQIVLGIGFWAYALIRGVPKGQEYGVLAEPVPALAAAAAASDAPGARKKRKR
ncbi:MAG: prolipoprotein diacylglyceryl transferase [Deltaproteobacteria bacterium]|nr:prolipoprotein diacylglyceryl transferase [Deltaproteobacteria bacterium]